MKSLKTQTDGKRKAERRVEKRKKISQNQEKRKSVLNKEGD